MKRAIRVVRKQVARNPVARAVARAEMKQAVTDFLLHAYMAEEGSDQTAAVRAVSKVIAVAIRVLEARHDAESPDARVMAGAMSALAQCSERGYRWREVDAPAVDAGITRALNVMTLAGSAETQKAWSYVESLL